MEILRTLLRIAILLSVLMPYRLHSQDADRQIETFRESYALENTGELQKSIEVLRAIYDEKSYEINLRLGWLTYLSGSFIESTSYYNRAVNLMPYAIEPRLGVVYPLSAMGNWDQVIGHYKKILDTDPQNSLVNYRLGVIYYNREEYNNSHKHLEKVVNLYPFDIDGLVMLAWCKFRLKQFREAKILFQRSLMHTPDSASAREGLSLIN
ncbi:MAG: tetratricopeptide repeat protein [Bacteroidales bacterium]